ncbi:MAG: YfhO family protein [Mogibacterium sp.]|nr:YfhO family protein [Mogibacterium sp.]
MKNTFTTLVTYTFLFCLMMAGIFLLFIIQHRTLVNHADAYDQGYFWIAEIKHELDSIAAGHGMPLWSWYRGTGSELKLNIDPFMYIAALFPAGSMELGYSVATLLRLYFAGIAFILFCKEVELSNYQALLGSLCYVSATWTINLALVQGHYTIMFLLFPLLAMSVDRICKGRSPFFFMLMVGLIVAMNYYLAYMTAIGIIIYIIFRYFKYYKFSIGGYAAYLGKFILFGIAGIMVSAFFFLVSVQSVTGATISASSVLPQFLPSRWTVLTEGMTLVSKGYRFSYGYIGIPIFALLTAVTVKGKPTIKATHTIMALLLVFMSMSPFCSSMFNGFLYATNRWFFILVFFVTWCAAEHMDLDELSKTHNILIMLLWWAVLVMTTLGFCYLDITDDLSKKSLAFVGGNLAAGFVMIIIVALGRKVITSLRARQFLIVMSVIGTLTLCWTASFYNETDYYFENGEINDQLEASTQRAGTMIEDDDFYRIDQVDWLNIHLNADQPVNENLWWQNDTIYLYESTIPGRLLEFNKLVGNNLGYSKRVYMQSNGNRMGLDFLYGVKYFLGDDTKNDRLGADAFAGYPFEYYDTLDGVNVFRSRYAPGLGFEYTNYMSESEFLTLSRLEREQALLQAVVIPDADLAALDPEREVKAKDLEFDIDNVDYEIVGTEGLTIEGNRIVADVEKAKLSLHVNNVENCQMIVSFDNLRRLNSNGADIGDFKVKCASGKLTAEASNKKNNQTIKGIVDYDLNMGYYDHYTGNLNIKFSQPGIYEFDKLYVSGMSVENFDKFAQERCTSTYKVTDRTSSKVSGYIDAADDGYLFLSLPVYGNWDIYIDGLPAAEIHNANYAFLATPVTKGHHEVELRYDYHNRKVAAGISIAGLALILIISIIDGISRSRKRKQNQSLKTGSDYIEKH